MTPVRLAIATAAAACAAAFTCAPASAQLTQGVTGEYYDVPPPAPPAPPPASAYTYIYGTMGFVSHNVGTSDLVTARWQLGGRINRFFGLEAEVGTGVNREGIGLNTLVVNGVPTPQVKETVKINDQEAAYVVGFLPVTENIDLFGRVGAQRTAWSFTGSAPWGTSDGSWNLGAGAIYFKGRNGARIEYLREQFDHAPASDSIALSYVRKF